MQRRRTHLLLACLAAAVAGGVPCRAADPCVGYLEKLQKARRMMERKTLLQEAIGACPQDSRVNFAYGYSLERFRKYEDALVYYRKAVELDPANAKAWTGSGDVYMQLGRVEAAVAAYEKGLQLDPDDSRTRHALDLALIKFKAEAGETISSEEFVKVMTETNDEGASAVSFEGPILRMQILFERDSAVLDDVSKDQLDTVGQALTSEALTARRFEIAGHTDSTGDPDYNLHLSRQRAESVKSYLIDRFGIEPARLVVAYYGETVPLVPNDSYKNQMLNRRVEFKLLRN